MMEDYAATRSSSYKLLSPLIRGNLTRLTRSRSVKRNNGLKALRKPASVIHKEMLRKGVSRPTITKRVSKPANSSKAEQELTAADVEQLEKHISCKQRLKIAVEPQFPIIVKNQHEIKGINPVGCVNRIVTNKQTGLEAMTFKSKRMTATLKHYRTEALAFENSEKFEKSLCKAHCDEDLDTDEELIGAAIRKSRNRLSEALGKVEKQQASGSTSNKKDSRTAETRNAGEDVRQLADKDKNLNK